MLIIKEKNKIKIKDTEDFCPSQILECGQIFRYEKLGEEDYLVFSKDKKANVKKIENYYEIITEDVEYFFNFFDLNTDYKKIKDKYKNSQITSSMVEKGKGIRILKGDFFEILISFIISANNNIKRIKKIISKLCEKAGDKKNGYFAFPTYNQLIDKDEKFFANIGAGYRSKYLVKAVSQFKDLSNEVLTKETTFQMRTSLIKFAGVGPKVADCILLFGLYRTDVFPVDVWIERVYYKYFSETKRSRNQIAKYLVEKFGNDSGYIQQYYYFNSIFKE